MQQIATKHKTMIMYHWNSKSVDTECNILLQKVTKKKVT